MLGKISAFLKSRKNKMMLVSSEYSANKKIVILDIGCRWGFAERFLKSDYFEDFKIFGFDPDENECRRLSDAYNHLPSGFVTCVPVGLAAAKGPRALYTTLQPACSSLHKPMQFLAENYPALKCISEIATAMIEVISLSDWALKAHVDNFDYIKLDTQGSELEILKGAGKILNTTRCIDIEVEFNPIYEGQTLFGETDAFLRSKGFALWRLSNLVHYSLGAQSLSLNDINIISFDENHRFETPAYGGQLFWADARYIKTDVLSAKNDLNINRDIKLFTALGMHDIVDHINKYQGIQSSLSLAD